jgi:hypothetical protein
MADVIGRTMSDTLTNHNEIFIRSLMDVMKEIMYGAPIHQIGLAYFNRMTRPAVTQSAVGDQVTSSAQGGSINHIAQLTLPPIT